MDLEQRIKAHALTCYKKLGFRSVTMDDIAQGLGISKKTIYQYFTDKASLVNALMDDELTFNKTSCLADKEIATNAVHEIFLAMKMMQQTFADMTANFLFELKKYHFDAYQKFEKFKNEFLFNIIKSNLERGIAEGLYRSDLDTEIITAVRLETMTMIFDERFTIVQKHKVLYVEEQMLFHFLYGIATPKGVKLIEKYSNQIVNDK